MQQKKGNFHRYYRLKKGALSAMKIEAKVSLDLLVISTSNKEAADCIEDNRNNILRAILHAERESRSKL